MKLLLYGDGGALALCGAGLREGPEAELTLLWRGGARAQTENDPQPEIIAQLAQEVYAGDILQLLVLHIWRFEFEVCRTNEGTDRDEGS
jgi:hypothetical protein